MLNQVTKRRVSKQLELSLPNPRGGARKGAGRKRAAGVRPHVPHRARPVHRAAHPVHVTLRARFGLPPFREQVLFEAIREALRMGSRSPAVGAAFRVVQFSVQRDHIHLIVEAHDGDVLARGMQGLGVRLARAVNRTLETSGRVWGDRFHNRELRTPREVRNALVYVLMNFKKHERGAAHANVADGMSSAPWFDGFRDATNSTHGLSPPVAMARTWLGSVGWRRRGLVRLNEAPARKG